MKVLMLDVDGVLIDGRPEDGLPLFTYLERDLGISLEQLQQTFFKLHWPEIVTGRAALMDRLSPVLAEIAPDVSAMELISYWFRNDARIIDHILDDVAALRARDVRVFLATNQEHLRASYLMNDLGFSARVDGIVYSALVGHEKPSPEFYTAATATAGVDPANIAFVDDRIENVSAARLHGWHAIAWQPQMRLLDALEPWLNA